MTASAFATLQDVSGGRMVMGIGRGDSARRDIGQKPVNVSEFEAACRMIRDLMNGRPVNWNDTEIELQWVGGRAEIPLYIAGYGPKVLAIAGRVADGVIVQVADPEVVEWIVGQVRRSAEAAGRDPSEVRVMCCAPAFVSDEPADSCDQVRWFPAMVANHLPVGPATFSRCSRVVEDACLRCLELVLGEDAAIAQVSQVPQPVGDHHGHGSRWGVGESDQLREEGNSCPDLI